MFSMSDSPSYPIDKVTLATLPKDLPGTHPLSRLLSRPKVELKLRTGQLLHCSPLYKGVDGLCPCARSRVQRLMRTSLELHGVELTLVETLRAPDRQEVYWKLGSTRTLNGKHEPAPPHWLGLAADLCPTEYLAMKGWNGGGANWEILGKLAEEAGMEWGGGWSGFVDKPHVELARCLCG